MGHLPKLTVLLFAALFSHLLPAADNLLFHGTLFAPPACKVLGTNSADVDVDFGDRVGITKVDGVANRLTIGYLIECEPGVSGLNMMLTLSGQPTNYDPTALQTNLANLGIKVLQNGTPLTLNQPLMIDAQSPPQLEAVLVTEPGATLTGGAFEANATLQIDYQ